MYVCMYVCMYFTFMKKSLLLLLIVSIVVIANSCKPLEPILNHEPKFTKQKMSTDFVILKKGNDTIYGKITDKFQLSFKEKEGIIKVDGKEFGLTQIFLISYDKKMIKPIKNKGFEAIYFRPKLSLYKYEISEFEKNARKMQKNSNKIVDAKRDRVTYCLLKNNNELQEFQYSIDGIAKAMSDKPELAKKVKALKKPWLNNQKMISNLTYPLVAGGAALAWGVISFINNKKDTTKNNNLNKYLIGGGAIIGAGSFVTKIPYDLKGKSIEQQIFAIMEEYNNSN
jgi:hypothetical protein